MDAVSPGILQGFIQTLIPAARDHDARGDFEVLKFAPESQKMLVDPLIPVLTFDDYPVANARQLEDPIDIDLMAQILALQRDVVFELDILDGSLTELIEHLSGEQLEAGAFSLTIPLRRLATGARGR